MPNWQKSSYCAQGEACVHVAAADTYVQLMESSDPTNAILTAEPQAFIALTRNLKEVHRG